MKHGDGKMIRSWQDLEWFGIEILTGEADGTGLRALFDLSSKGCEIMDEFLGTTIRRGNGWNDTRPDAASMMIPLSIYRDLAVFCLMKEGHDVILDVRCYNKAWSSDFIEGMSQEEWDEIKERADLLWPDSYRLHKLSGDTCGGTRNYHQIAMRSR